MSPFFGWFIVVWSVLLFGLMMIGGYFMFRKFFKSMPKEDGMSTLDWQDHYIDKTRHMWTDETLEFLNELVSPVPELFRAVARRTIAAKIGELALEGNIKEMNQDIVVKGYIMATPARDHKWLVDHLKKKGIDFWPYKEYLKIRVE